MKKTLLYILLLHFLSAVLADWTTIEHDFKMCDRDVPSHYAAIHIDDGGISYSSSFLVRNIQNVTHAPPITVVNVTMWGCTYDCSFNFLVKLNRDDQTVSSYTEKNGDNNYKCFLNKYTMNLLPTPKITYKQIEPNPDHVFPPDLTAQYCSQGIHPDKPTWAIPATDHVAECIDHLTGREVGTYLASLEFGVGSSFKPDGYGVATYHMIDSANKLFDYWERHHRGFHDALVDLSLKMTDEHLKELAPPPPEHKKDLFMEIFPAVFGLVLFAAPLVGPYLATAVVAGIGRMMAEVSELGAEMGAAEDAIAASAEGSLAREAAEAWQAEAVHSVAFDVGDAIYRTSEIIKECPEPDCNKSAVESISFYYSHSDNPDVAQILDNLNRQTPNPPHKKRDTMDNLGFYTANMVNAYFLGDVMTNVHESFTGSGQTYPDISSYLTAASESLLSHFQDTLHNNFFAGNKSILTSFTVHQGANDKKLIGSNDDLFDTIKSSTYNTMAASIISAALRKFNVVICDNEPDFCGEECDGDYPYYCPKIGKDNCVITATDGRQIDALKSLRDTSDICSNDEKSGWNITHNSNCDKSLFICDYS